MYNGIRDISTTKDSNGKYTSVRITFGPHYFIELHAKKVHGSAGVDFVVGATHHGFKADASEVNGELEKLIYEVRESHPGNVID
jgi:hypothetical protein